MHKSLLYLLALAYCVTPSTAQAIDNDFAEFGPMPTCRNNLCCKSYAGVLAGAELTLLTPHSGSLAIGPAPIAADRDMGVGGRYWLGYRAESGLGFRSRYWHFDQEADGGPVLAASLSAQTWDAELTQLFTRGRYVFDLSGGVRWAKIDDQVGPLLTDTFDGWGSTVAFSGRRQLGNGPFSLIGGARGSLLYGDRELTILGFPVTSAQEVMPVMEMHLGGEFSKNIWGNSHTFVRAAFEAQMWELPPSAVGLLDQNIGFAGVTFATGIRY